MVIVEPGHFVGREERNIDGSEVCAIVSACAEIRPRDIRHPRRAAVPGAHLHGWRLL